MKKVIKVILCSLFLGNIVQADVSWEGDPEAYITERKGVITKKDAALFLNLLEEMPWIEERARINTQRYIYVLYFPECPASQALYEESREYLQFLNIRWIPYTDREENFLLYEERTPVVLKSAFEGRLNRKVKDMVAAKRVSDLTISAFEYWTYQSVFSPKNQLHFPTVIFGNKNQLSVYVSPYIEDILNEIVKTKPSNAHPKILDFAKDNPHVIKKGTEGVIYQSERGRSLEVFLTTGKNPFFLGTWDLSIFPNKLEGITTDGYMVIDATGEGNYLYFKDPDPQLEFPK